MFLQSNTVLKRLNCQENYLYTNVLFGGTDLYKSVLKVEETLKITKSSIYSYWPQLIGVIKTL